MFKLDDKGYWEPTKMFPCDCGSEGVTVTLSIDDDYSECGEAPYFDMCMWQNRKLWENCKMPWKIRLWAVWMSLQGKTPWMSQVSFTAGTARNMANHILYQLSIHKPKQDVTMKEADAFFDKAAQSND